jgi:hypothetical protein
VKKRKEEVDYIDMKKYLLGGFQKLVRFDIITMTGSGRAFNTQEDDKYM